MKTVPVLSQLIADDRYLDDIILANAPQNLKNAAEHRAAAVLAQEGKTVPGWKYTYHDGDLLPKVERKLDHRAGLFGGEWAALAQAMLMADFQSYLISLKTTVQVEVCVRLDYCNKLRSSLKTSKDWDALIEFAEWVIKQFLSPAFPPVALAVYLVKRGILDRWCDCESMTSGPPTTASHSRNASSRRHRK